MPQVSKLDRRTTCSSDTGFSLVELMVVVMVILVIAAIAIPSLVHARMHANESSAIGSMRAVRTAELLYQDSYPEEGFSDSLIKLGPNGSDCTRVGKTNSCLLMDENLASGLKSGYIFDLTGDGSKPTGSYTLTATPESSGVSGRCSFSSDASGQITMKDGNGMGGGAFSVNAGGGGGCDH
jgi:type IV pilus assembly protein PilA